MLTDEQTGFCTQLPIFFEQVNTGSSLKTLRTRAFDHFLKLGLPDKNSEAFQYVPLAKIYKESFSFCETHSFTKEKIKALVAPESKNSFLVFINGIFDLDLSNISALPSQIVVMPLDEAVSSYGAILQSRWSKTLNEMTDPFASLNLALHPRGVFVYVPPKIVVDTPIQCLFLTSDQEVFSCPRLQFFLAFQAEIKIITSTIGPGFSNGVVDIALEDRAKASCVDVSSGEGVNFSYLKATLKKESSLSTLSLYPQRDLTRYCFDVRLQGENSEANLQGGWFLKDKEEVHIHATVRHEAPFCRSMQKFKGVLSCMSHSSFEGKIFVEPQAQKTEAYQLNNNLILGEHACANSKPNLEIFADDVKASHGATVSQLNYEELFYLKSRGIAEDVAKNLLMQSFVGEIIQQIPYPSMVANVRKTLLS